MSIGYFVRGVMEPDDTWKKNKAVWDACEAAGVEIPDEVQNFFDFEPPRPGGKEVELKHRQHSDGAYVYYDVRLDELPPGVHVIRFKVG